MRIVVKLLIGISSVFTILLIGFLGYIMLDMNAVEKRAKGCETLSIELERYKQNNGSYPDDIGLLGVTKELRLTCNYHKHTNGYSFALSGTWINLLAYVYDPAEKSWHWD